MDTKLKVVADHLNALLSEHKKRGEHMRVILQDDPDEPYMLVRVVHSHKDYNELTLFYKCGSDEEFSTGFSKEEARGIRLYGNGVLGVDSDGEWVRVEGRVVERVKATGAGKPQRSITSVKTIDGAEKNAAINVKDLLAAAPLIPGAYARASVFNGGQLGRGSKAQDGNWEIHTSNIQVKSEHPRLHQEHRCIMEYLIDQATRHGLTFIAPAPKIMNCMNMRFTKHSIAYGKEAMQVLLNTVVQSKVLVEGVPQWVELRFLDAFDWGSDGAVKVSVSAGAVSTFKPAVNKELRAQLIRENSAGWFQSWLAGFVANNEGVILQKEELNQLANLETTLQENVFGMLTALPCSEPDTGMYPLWVDEVYSRAERRKRNSEYPDFFVHPRETRTPEELKANAEAEFQIQKTRMTEKIQSGMYLTDGRGTVAWRLKGVDLVEIVPFEKSGLVPENV